jgi:hypothetical protein
MIYVNTRVLEFWVMEITNIYDFLHLLSLIKIISNMDFGGDLAFAHICHNLFLFFKECGKRLTSKYQSKR